MPDKEPKATSRELDEALEDTFPASDPPSMTSPLAATPAAGAMHQHGHGDEVRVWRVVSMADASTPTGTTSARSATRGSPMVNPTP